MFQFTQPKRAATSDNGNNNLYLVVSIHAAQAGCDCLVDLVAILEISFNSRSPSGLRPFRLRLHLLLLVFQFTQPKRAATGCASNTSCYKGCFNSRSPSGLRPRYKLICHFYSIVSIHAAQAGCDQHRTCHQPLHKVSIHAAQAGCDLETITHEKLKARVSIHAAQAGCDMVLALLRCLMRVSIHAAQAGCDLWLPLLRLLPIRFNSRSPSGLRRLLQRYNKKEIHSKDKSRKSILVIILDEEAKAVKLELTDNQPLRNSNKIMFTWDSQPNIFV